MNWMEGPAAKAVTLLLLRVTTGFLLIWWGLDKVLAVGHALAVSNEFYGGLFSSAWLQRGFGVLQTLLGLAVVLGLWRRLTLPAMALITGFSAVAVWYAIIDPFRWYLPPQTDFPFTQLFYPSAIILAASLLLIAFRHEDRLALDRRHGARG